MFDLMLKTESPDKPWNDHFCDSFSKPKTTFKNPRLILKYTVAFITAISVTGILGISNILPFLADKIPIVQISVSL